MQGLLVGFYFPTLPSLFTVGPVLYLRIPSSRVSHLLSFPSSPSAYSLACRPRYSTSPGGVGTNMELETFLKPQ